MATTSKLGTHRADVTVLDPDGQQVVIEARVAVRVRPGAAYVRRGGLTLLERTDVLSVEREAGKAHRVRFEDGSQWFVQKPDCGCHTHPTP